MVFILNFFRNILINIMAFYFKRKARVGLAVKGLDTLLPKPVERKHVIIKVYKKSCDINMFLMKICNNCVEENDCLIYELNCSYFDLLWIPYFYEDFYKFVMFDDFHYKVMLTSFLGNDFDYLVHYLDLKILAQFDKRFLKVPKSSNLVEAEWLSILKNIRDYVINLTDSFKSCDTKSKMSDKEYKDFLSVLNKGREDLITYFNFMD